MELIFIIVLIIIVAGLGRHAYDINKQLKQLKRPNYTDNQIDMINGFKNAFRLHFDKSTIMSFGITKFEYFFDTRHACTVTIYLERPGLLIGEKGKVLDEFEEYLNSDTYAYQIFLKDSELWKLESN